MDNSSGPHNEPMVKDNGLVSQDVSHDAGFNFDRGGPRAKLFMLRNDTGYDGRSAMTPATGSFQA